MVTILFNAGLFNLADFALGAGVTDEYWRTVTTLFVYTQNGYEIAVLAAVFLFGWLLERRHGPLGARCFVFFVGGAGGMFLAIAGGDADLALGANGAALALLGAWAVRDLLGRRRGEEDDSDMLGVLAIAVVLVLLPLASEEASALAGIGGGADRPDPRARARAYARALSSRFGANVNCGWVGERGCGPLWRGWALFGGAVPPGSSPRLAWAFLCPHTGRKRAHALGWALLYV